ncbi:hypothetical protein Bcer98_1693 [Bacillus cytotoxicus NVH 391-98]|uniref:Uncharacterized protein n=1 Tax=Bacillus cytotoxicus (strain DSM 22905 / CIP 110041 / 391-98 / NVH 391-98) TaxID=315749 RepID=A7GPE2_BACCN|nr:hypothetical protein Bcer98_1693 [Bacillus cytotoxicus NVH 391-98]
MNPYIFCVYGFFFLIYNELYKGVIHMKMNEYSVDLEGVKKMLELYSKLKDTDIFKEFYEEESEPIKIEKLKI